MIAIVVHREAAVAKVFFNHHKSKAMNKNQKNPVCCDPANGCCGTEGICC